MRFIKELILALFVAVLIMVVLWICILASIDAANAAEYDLLCSTDKVLDGTDGVCTGRPTQRDIYAYIWPETNIDHVDFDTDNAIHQKESYAPYELKGGDPFNLLGAHVVKTVVTKTDGSTVILDDAVLTVELRKTSATSVYLEWLPNTDGVDGYKAYHTNKDPSVDDNYWWIADIVPESNVKLNLPNVWCDLHMKADTTQDIAFKLTAFKGVEESDRTPYVTTTLDKDYYHSRGEWCSPNVVEVTVR